MTLSKIKVLGLIQKKKSSSISHHWARPVRLHFRLQPVATFLSVREVNEALVTIQQEGGLVLHPSPTARDALEPSRIIARPSPTR